MSDAGKPIFARFGNEAEISRLCGLLRTILAGCEDVGLGSIRGVRMANMRMVFMSVASITLVAISKAGRNGTTPTEAYLRLQLEYVYGLIMATLTDQIQKTLVQDPSYDLRILLGASEAVLRSVLDECDNHPAQFISGTVSSFFPLSSFIRDRTSHVLHQVGDVTPNTLYAMMFANSELITIVQPSNLPLSVSDLNIFRQIVTRQLHNNTEMWLPICLPRINSSGFLYCYINALCEQTILTLVSQHGTTEQFELFRQAATDIRLQLGLKTSVSILEILDPTSEARAEGGTDVLWRRVEETSGVDDDYVDASGDGDRMIPYVGGAEESLLAQIEGSKVLRESLMRDYLEAAGAHHFVFRLDVPLRKGRRRSHMKQVSFPQCISSPFATPLESMESQQDVWHAYQRLNLRLRLGSATVEATMDAFDMITRDHSGETETLGIGKFCPAASLLESPPNIEGLSYLSKDSLTYLAINGVEFEL